MAKKPDLAQLRDELVDAFEWGEEDRARALISKLATQPRQARAALEEMLESSDASVRQAAAFGLGELGGTASVKRLEQQVAIEESRGDYDGASVIEVITQALGRIQETSARASLMRRLQRVLDQERPAGEVDAMTYALWRKRHPELFPLIRRAIAQLPPKDSLRLRALLRLMETPPEALVSWVLDPSAPLEEKTKALTVLDEEVPQEFLPVIVAFVSAANALVDSAVSQAGAASAFCDRLFTTLLLHPDQILPALPTTARDELGVLARRCLAAHDLSCALGAAAVLYHVGRPEDVALLEAHRPADPAFAKVFDEAAQALRGTRHE